MLSVLLSITAGALLGGIVRALVDSYQHFRESKGLARALQAEISALRHIIEQRAVPQQVERTIAVLEDPTRTLQSRDLFGLRVSEDYFSVFRAITPKIGFLGDIAADAVVFYSLSKAVVEELTEMRDRRAEMTRANATGQVLAVDREELLDRAKELRELLAASVAASQSLLQSLEKFAARRWMGLMT